MEKSSVKELIRVYDKICKLTKAELTIDDLEPLVPLLDLEIDALIDLYEYVEKSTFCKLLKLIIEVCRRDFDPDFLALNQMAAEVFAELPVKQRYDIIIQAFMEQNDNKCKGYSGEEKSKCVKKVVRKKCNILLSLIEQLALRTEDVLWKEIIESDNTNMLRKNPKLFLKNNKSTPKKLPDWRLEQIALTSHVGNNRVLEFLLDNNVVGEEQGNKLFQKIIDYLVDIEDKISDGEDIDDYDLFTPLINAEALISKFDVYPPQLDENAQIFIFNNALQENVPRIALFFIENYELDRKEVENSILSHIESGRDYIDDILDDPFLVKVLYRASMMGIDIDTNNYFKLEEFQKQPSLEEYQYNSILSNFTSDTAKTDEGLKKLIMFHRKICLEKAKLVLEKIRIDKEKLDEESEEFALRKIQDELMKGELKYIPESWKIRLFFPKYNNTTPIKQYYAETFGEFCNLLKAAIFCHDLQDSNFTLEEIKQIGAVLYPENKEQFENVGTKKDICALLAESMDANLQPSQKKDPRVTHCTGVDITTQYAWDEFTPDELDQDEVIKIFFDDPKNPACYLKSSIMEGIDRSPNYFIMHNWIPSTNSPMDDQGRPGKPGEDNFYRLPDNKFIDESSYEMIKKGDDTSFKMKNVEKVRLGRLESDYGSGYVSNMHGQLPGYDVYTLELNSKKSSQKTDLTNTGKRRKIE